jgi:DinB superfamily
VSGAASCAVLNRADPSQMITDVNESIRPTAHTSRRAIIEALEAAHEAGQDYWANFTTAEFFAPIGEHWSAAAHVRHLTRSMTPLLPVLRVPRVALRLAFGAATSPSRSYEQLEALYDRALAAGGTAGRYAPSQERADGDTARRDAIMDAHSETLRGLTQAMDRWTEAQLDAHRLPHPLLGKLTVREMMLFTLLHNQHHVSVAERRRLEALGLPALL